MPATAAKTLSKIKVGLLLDGSFFGGVVCRKPLTMSEDIPTMATDGTRIYYNPKAVNAWTFEENKFVVAHEVMHIVLEHPWRRGTRDAKRWNQACDYAVNYTLVNAKVRDKKTGAMRSCTPGIMPTDGLYNEALFNAGGGTAEGIYDLLPPATDDGNGGQSNGHGDPLDDCMDAPGDQAERAQTLADNKIMVGQVVQAAKACGQLPSTLEQAIDSNGKGVVDWKAAMRDFINAKAKVDLTWQKFNRRLLAQDIYLPSLNGYRIGEIAFWQDVSGSIMPKERDAYFNEQVAIKQDLMPPAMHVGYFTEKVVRFDTYDEDEDIRAVKVGSGGTAFSPIFAYMADNGVEPACCVILTDLECNDFGPEPAYPVLWVSTGRDDAPWGQVVMMKNIGLHE